MRIEITTSEKTMRNSIKCCISCILPCGALDVIRIVHCNGRVEEISGTIKACEIMKAYPKHVLKKPSSPCSNENGGGVVPKIVVVPPDAELQRGKIYFLMPLPSPPPPPPPPEKNHHRHQRSKKKKEIRNCCNRSNNNGLENDVSVEKLVVSNDRYLSEILSEKLSSQKDRRRGRVAVWRPHLESISESPTDIIM